MERDSLIVLLLLVALVAWPTAAFTTPFIMSTDTVGDASPEHVRRLKSQARITTKLPVIEMEVREARVTGPTPDHIAGEVRFLTLFGIPWATLNLGEPGHSYHWHLDRWFAVWALFLAVEALLFGALGWQLWTAA